MSVEISGMTVRVKYISKSARLRSVEVMIDVHPLQLPRLEITSLHSLCNGKECWVRVGHTAPGIDEHCFVAYGPFFQSGVPYIGAREKLHEAIQAIIEAVKPVLESFEKEPIMGKVLR